MSGLHVSVETPIKVLPEKKVLPFYTFHYTSFERRKYSPYIEDMYVTGDLISISDYHLKQERCKLSGSYHW